MKKIIAYFILTMAYTEVFAQIKDEFPVRKFTSNDSMINLLNNFYTGKSQKINPYFLPKKKDLNEKAKNKLLSILRHEWPESILKIRVQEKFITEFEYLHFYPIIDEINKMSKKAIGSQFIALIKSGRLDTSITVSKAYQKIYDSIYHVVYDSAAEHFRKEAEQKIKETSVPDVIVLTAGALKIKEAIPILRNDLQSPGKHYFNKEATEIALAGLGDTALQTKYFKTHDSIVTSNDRYALWQDFLNLALVINTQQSVSKFIDWVDTSKTYLNNSGEGDSSIKYYTAKELVPNLLWFIKNKSLKTGYMKLPMKEGYISYYEPNGVTEEQMIFLRNWLIKNKGKYEFD